MKIAIISDSHDHLANLKMVLDAVKDTDALIHCGDLVAPFSIPALAGQYQQPIHFVWGNNDGDHENCEKNAKEFPHFKIHGDVGELTVAGKKIVFNHFPQKADELARKGSFDLVCYGHTHKTDLQTVGKTVMVNPGDVMGRFDSKAHYAIYDTETGKAELKFLDANPA